jgi:hypothetical protein
MGFCYQFIAAFIFTSKFLFSIMVPGCKILDMAQSVGYNEHVDHSGSAVGMLLVTKVAGF